MASKKAAVPTITSALGAITFVLLALTGVHPDAAVETPTQNRSATFNLTEVQAKLDALVVRGKAPKTRYSREQFGPAWKDVDGNRCDTRNDILARDLAAVTLGGNCKILSGTLLDPYTGAVIEFERGPNSAAVQIDHIVALGDAWVSGAWNMAPGKRANLANDPDNLLAVDGPTNSAKGDKNAAEWLPPNKAIRCEYVSRQVIIKDRYSLSVTAAEKTAIETQLDKCQVGIN